MASSQSYLLSPDSHGWGDAELAGEGGVRGVVRVGQLQVKGGEGDVRVGVGDDQAEVKHGGVILQDCDYFGRRPDLRNLVVYVLMWSSAE